MHHRRLPQPRRLAPRHPRRPQTLPTTFRKAGYSVRGAGKIYHGGFDRPAEWDDYLADEGPSPATARPPTAKNGVGGIKFAPLDCDDDDLND